MKIVITPRGFANCGLENARIIEEAGFDLEYNDTGKAYTKEEFYERTADADGVIVGVELVDKEYVDAHPKLKAVVKFGVGTDNIDLDYCRKKGIFVGKTAGSNARSVAETAVAFMLADSKNLYGNVSDVRKNNWSKSTGYEIENKTLGIIGFGAIGKKVAQMAYGLGMKVLVYDPYFTDHKAAASCDARVVALEEVIRCGDFISLHIPLTAETKDLIALPQLKEMKKNAVLINTARGEIVNEKDLYLALSQGWIRSAYFDVFSSEPPKSDEPLMNLPNFYLTPHIASRSREAEKKTSNMATEILVAELKKYV